MTNSTLELLKRATTHTLNREPAIPELSFIEKIPQPELESLITGFDELIKSFNRAEAVVGGESLILKNTQALKEATPTLPTITEMMEGEKGDRTGLATLRLFGETTRDFKEMVDKGTIVANASPDADILELDEQTPDALFFHREPGAPENGLIFGTTLHILEMYLNKRFSQEFAGANFETRKDWLLDMCMEQMIVNEGLGINKNPAIHTLFDLVNNQLGWIEGYPNIDPELREMALLEPLRDLGLEPIILDKENFAKDSLIVDSLVEFDKVCFGEHPTGSETNGPPLLRKEDIISGIEEHENEFLILMNGHEIAAALQYYPRTKDQSMHIMSLAVRPENRRQSIAKKLKSWIEAEAEARGIDKITTRIDPNNAPIVTENFNRQFVVTGARNKEIKGHPNNVMTLALTKLFNPPEAIFEEGAKPKYVVINDYQAIDQLANEGYRGVQIETGKDRSTTLIMQKMNEVGLAAYPYWT